MSTNAHRDEVLMTAFPSIRWRAPIDVHSTSGVKRIGCRLCIAQHGLRGAEIGQEGTPGLFEDFAAWRAHMLEAHPPADGGR